VIDLEVASAAGRELVEGGLAFARINWSRIVVDCPRRWCTSALSLPPGWEHFQCWDCGWSAPVVWPANLPEIVAVLALRPDPKTRNWEIGETVMGLVRENIEHGILPSVEELAAAQEQGPLLLTRDGMVVTGAAGIVGDVAAARAQLDTLAGQDPHTAGRPALGG
jgi:hypothetical protein